MFSTTPSAQEAVQETLDRYQARLKNLLLLYPEQKLTIAQGAMALSIGEGTLLKVLNKQAVTLDQEVIKVSRNRRRPTPMVSLDQLEGAFTWRYPSSYPQELIPSEHLA